MAENDDVSGGPGRDAPPPDETAPAAPAEPASQPVLKTRWRDRAWSFRDLLAVALASLLVGGLAGGAVVAASGDDNDREQSRIGPWGPGGQMPPGWRRHRFNDGGPQWRGPNGPQQGPTMTPFGTPTTPAPTPSPGSTS